MQGIERRKIPVRRCSALLAARVLVHQSVSLSVSLVSYIGYFKVEGRTSWYMAGCVSQKKALSIVHVVNSLDHH